MSEQSMWLCAKCGMTVEREKESRRSCPDCGSIMKPVMLEDDGKTRELKILKE